MKLLRILEIHMKKHATDHAWEISWTPAKMGRDLSKNTNLYIIFSAYNECMFLFEIIDRLKRLVENEHEEILNDFILKVIFLSLIVNTH